MAQVNLNESVVAPTPTPRFESTLARATRLAQEMGHAQVGTEHLLLALPEDKAGIAGQILDRQGGESIKRAIEAILADPACRTPSRRIDR